MDHFQSSYVTTLTEVEETIETITIQSVGTEYRIRVEFETDEKDDIEEKSNEKGSSMEEEKANSASKLLERACSLQSIDAGDYYRCHELQTGYVLVVLFTEDRPGAFKDIENIKGFMEGTLRYEYNFVQDLDKETLIKTLKNTAKALNDYSRKYFCFTLFIMGHGSKKGIKTQDEFIKEREIISIFKNKEMENFAGKPKAFFIQCCRGKRKQETVGQPHYDAHVESENIMVPNEADIFIAHSTTEGMRSRRCPQKGSYFIASCINEFKKNYLTAHLEDMIIAIRRDIAFHPNGEAQMANSYSTLTKKFFFKPNFFHV